MSSTQPIFQQYFIMFGPFILILVFSCGVKYVLLDNRMNWKFGLQAAGVLLATFAAGYDDADADRTSYP